MFEPVKNQRISDEILRQIRDAVLEGKFEVGDRLPNEREDAGVLRALREVLDATADDPSTDAPASQDRGHGSGTRQEHPRSA